MNVKILSLNAEKLLGFVESDFQMSKLVITLTREGSEVCVVKTKSISSTRIEFSADFMSAEVQEGSIYKLELAVGDAKFAHRFIYGAKAKILKKLRAFEIPRTDHSVMKPNTESFFSNHNDMVAYKYLLIRLRRAKRGRGISQGFKGVEYDFYESDWRLYRAFTIENIDLLFNVLDSRYLLSIVDTFSDHGSEVERGNALAISNIFVQERFAQTLRCIYWLFPRFNKLKTRQRPAWDGLFSNKLSRDDSLQIFLARQSSVLETTPILKRIFIQLYKRMQGSKESLISENVNQSEGFQRNINAFNLEVDQYEKSQRTEGDVEIQPLVANQKPTARKVDALDLAQVDIVFHIGAPKTGTSVLQKFLANNRDWLTSRGIYYPPHGLDKNGVSGGHSELGTHILNGDMGAATKVIDRYLADAKQSSSLLLISAESLFNHPERIREISNKYKVKILSYYRDPIASTVSLYHQSVKRHMQGSRVDNFIQYVLKQDNDSVSGKIFDRWASEFSLSDLRVEYYNKDYYETNDLMSDFLGVLGIYDYRQLHLLQKETKRVNGSYTAGAVELKRLINRVLNRESKTLDRDIDRLLQSYSDKEPCDEGLLTESQYNTLAVEFQNTKDYVVGKYVSDSSLKRIKLKTEGGVVIEGARYSSSLEEVFYTAFKESQSTVKDLSSLLLNAISKDGKKYEFNRLAEIMNVDVSNFPSDSHVFKDAQIENMLNEKAGLPDLLRESALLLERAGRKGDALKLISRAKVLRPNGAGINKIYNKLMD